MSTIGYALAAAVLVIGLILCVIILMQSKRSAGLGAVGGSSSNSDSYWNKNKGPSLEGALEKYTKIGGALFMILAFIINLVG